MSGVIGARHFVGYQSMRFSKAFGLNKGQAELDFVDIDLEIDQPLYVDPFALSIRKDAWSHRCTQHIVSFFQTAVDAIRANNHDRAREVLTNLSEPNETRLGLSRGEPSGRGVSGKQAFDLYEALAESEAAKTGLLDEIAECDLFIPGISHDKISDITTNVIRGPLIEYTQKQCELHRIPVQQIAAGKIWNMDLGEWTSVYGSLPVHQDQRILLVPKASVRYRLSLDSQEYYNHYMLNFLQSEHLQAGSALVKVFKNGRRYVTKKSLKDVFPFSKLALFDFTKQHPQVLETYKTIAAREREESNRRLDEELYEPALCDALAMTLQAIPAGRDGTTEFHDFIVGAIEFIFYPHLIYPVKEAEIDDGRKRIDITYTNAARDGFFYRVHTAHQVASNLVMVECKNYVHDMGNKELDQLSGRFSVNRGKLGLLIARTFDDQDLFIERCRDAAAAGRGFIIPLVDLDILAMLDAIKGNERTAIDARLEGIFRRLIS